MKEVAMLDHVETTSVLCSGHWSVPFASLPDFGDAHPSAEHERRETGRGLERGSRKPHPNYLSALRRVWLA